MTHDSHIFIRMFSTAASETEASEIGEKIANTICYMGKVVVVGLKPYWKIPDNYECLIELHSPNISVASVKQVTNILGDGWKNVGSNSLVWNRSDRKYFIDNRVNWAWVEFLEI